MKRQIALIFCLLMITMPLAGCIGNDDSNEDDSQPEEIVELQDWHVHFAVNAADLPTCNEDTNGRLYYVEADNEFQVCKTAGWDVISIMGEDGAPGQDGNEGEKGEIGVQGIPGPNGKTTLISILSSNNCPNGGYSFEIGTDDNSDNVLTSDEVTLVTDICNGEVGSDGATGSQGPQGPAGNDGAQGPQGPAGNDGATGPQGNDGADGQDGAPGSQGPQGPAGNDGADGQDGADGAPGPQGPQGPAGNDGADGQDGADGPPGPQGAQGPQGPAGNDGADGQDGADGPPGPQGAQGPAGNDGADGQDGADGADGQDGAQGPTGPTGMAGTSSLIISSTEPAGSNCAAGGIKIGIGIDDNGDMQLQNSEIDSTLYVCDGEDGVAISIPWVDITGIPSDIADGDQDTTYDGSDFAVSNRVCSSNMVMMGINSIGHPICVIDNDTTVSGSCPSTDYYMYGISSSGYVMCYQVQDYDGNDFAVSNQECSTGQVMKGITSNGLVICVTDIDTSFAGQCSTGLVMRGVSSSGSAICISDSDTTYDGYDFAESGQTCSYGYSVYGISSNGQVICMQTKIYAGSGLELNGNYLSISSSGCIAGEVMKRNLGNYGWECVADEDTTYDGYDFATSNQVCATGQKVSGINSAGDIICVSDMVNTYDGTDFALSDQTCSSSQKILAINANGQIVCASDVVNTYDGTDFATSGQTCPTGQYVEQIDSNGVIQCSAPESGSPIMPGTLTGGSYTDGAFFNHHVVYQQFLATDSGSYDKITYFYTGTSHWHGSVYVAIYDDYQGHPGQILDYNYLQNIGANHNAKTHFENNYYHENLIDSVSLVAGEIYWVAILSERQFGPSNFELAENADYDMNFGLVQYDTMPIGSYWTYNPTNTVNDDRAFWFMIS